MLLQPVDHRRWARLSAALLAQHAVCIEMSDHCLGALQRDRPRLRVHRASEDTHFELPVPFECRRHEGEVGARL